MRDLHGFIASKKNSADTKRFDEVLYVPVSFPYAETPVKSTPIYANTSNCDLESAVASPFPVGEVFYFDYGVTVVWGVDECNEAQVLDDLKAFEVRPLSKEDVEVEAFHFCHNDNVPPQLVNDTINLKSGHYMIKLTISHALAQSVKLAFFEELVEHTILRTKDIPSSLAEHGIIAMSRKSITKQIGELFVMRINVNLVSNVLDTPEIFWAEPLLCPLYKSVRIYLEITQRVEVLNQRCSVLSDLLDMLREHANHIHAEALEWIVIILISLEIFIGLFEIFINLYLHRKVPY